MGDERGGGTVRGLAIVVLAASALALWCAPARAHVHSVRTEQLPGRLGTLELRVPHGCGDSATTRIDVQIAEGVTDVKPLPHDGWAHEAVRGPDGGVTHVSWSGGPLLSREETEFTLQARYPDKPGARLWFPVVQTCEQGRTRWVEIPRPGESAGELPHPAAWVDLVAPGGSRAEREVSEGGVVPLLSMGAMGALAAVALLLIRHRR